MKIQSFKHLELKDIEWLTDLWNKEFPVHVRMSSINQMNDFLDKWEDKTQYVIRDDKGKMIAWSMFFIRDQEPWFTIIVDEKHQRKGLGELLLRRMQNDHMRLLGWVVDHSRDKKNNGKIYQSPISFYLKHGFKIHPKVRMETETTSTVLIEWERPERRLPF